MKARWTIAAALFAVAAATLVLAGAALAKPPSQTGQVFHIDDTYIDPFFSDLCGFDVLQHDVGVIKTTFLPDGRFREQISLRQTVTNPETGTFLVYRTTGSRTFSFEPIDENGSFEQTLTFTGLNFRLFAADGTPLVSSGRGVTTFTVVFDENGNLVDVTFEERATPHLEHFTDTNIDAIVCETLAQ
jgi:hypothetical protein